MENEAKMKIPEGHKVNFDQLKRAFANDDVVLMSCTDRTNGEQLTAICAVNRGVSEDEDEYEFVPFAFMTMESLMRRLIPATTQEVDIYKDENTIIQHKV